MNAYMNDLWYRFQNHSRNRLFGTHANRFRGNNHQSDNHTRALSPVRHCSFVLFFSFFFLSFQYIVHCYLTSSTHLHFNIQHKCCSFLNGESNFQGDHEEILSCLNYKHFMKSFKFIKSEFGVKSFGSSKKKISLLSHPLKARLTG